MKPLAIDGIEIFLARMPFPEPFRISLMEIRDARTVFVRVHASDGTFGMGEGNPLGIITGETGEGAFAVADTLARLLVGRDPLDIEGRLGELTGFLVHNPTLHSAFDMALYDLAAKVAGLPLYAFLGGGKRTVTTDNTLGIDDPERMAARARDFVARGFAAIKVKLGTTQGEDVARIRAIRDAVGPDIALRIDANQGWDPGTAMNTLRALEPFGIEYCEQPVAHWDFENLRRVTESTSIPIMADESLFDHRDAFELARRGACNLFNIKLAKSGGIHTALRINAIAEAANIPCMLGCMTETRLGLSAGAHLVSARRNIRYADLDGWYHLAVEDPVRGGAAWNEGEITLSDEPGHGADLDPGFTEACEKKVVE